MRRVILFLFAAAALLFGQAEPNFEVATVKPAVNAPGKSWETITADPVRFSASGAPLRQLIFEAYGMPYSRIFGGPPWLDSEYYDLEGKSEKPVDRAQLRLMLRSLLADRFHLTVHRETRELRAYVLTAPKGGSKLHSATAGAELSTSSGLINFRGNLTDFANLLAIRLNMPAAVDPNTPVRSTGVPPPVIDQTGLTGIFDISVGIKLDPAEDVFVAWQRVLQDQLGLKLESRKEPVEVLVIDHADRIPTAN